MIFKKNKTYNSGLGNPGVHFGRFSTTYETAGGATHRATWWQFGRKVVRHRIAVLRSV